MSTQITHFTESYATQLEDHMPYYAKNSTQAVVEGVASGDIISEVTLASDPKHIHTYLDTRKLDNHEQAHNDLLFYVPGFTEGVVAKTPFAAALHASGIDVILPNQHRKVTPTVAYATRLQALDNMAILANEGLQDSRVHMFGHSYGSMVASEMVTLADRWGWTCFKDSEVIFGAPAGIGDKQSLIGLGLRFLKSLKSEGKKVEKTVPDSTGDMFKAGQSSMLANPLRATKEVLAMHRYRIALETLVSGVGRLTVLQYKDDELFPDKVLLTGSDRLAEAGGLAATPISLRRTNEFVYRDNRLATHNDEQFNPQRVAGAVVQILRSNGRIEAQPFRFPISPEHHGSL